MANPSRLSLRLPQLANWGLYEMRSGHRTSKILLGHLNKAKGTSCQVLTGKKRSQFNYSKASNRLHNEFSHWFGAVSGVRQACEVLGFLFQMACIDVVYGHGEWQGKIPAGDGGISCLLMDKVLKKFTLYLKKSGLASRNIVHLCKKHSTLCRFLPLYS